MLAAVRPATLTPSALRRSAGSTLRHVRLSLSESARSRHLPTPAENRHIPCPHQLLPAAAYGQITGGFQSDWGADLLLPGGVRGERGHQQALRQAPADAMDQTRRAPAATNPNPRARRHAPAIVRTMIPWPRQRQHRWRRSGRRCMTPQGSSCSPSWPLHKWPIQRPGVLLTDWAKP